MKLHFRELRQKIKRSQREVMDKFLGNHDINICFFCGCDKNLTKEHVIPQWVFEGQPERFFTATINQQPQTYMQSTIPACARCNNVLLSSIEDEIISILKAVKPGSYSFEQNDMLIWWLELIGFKMQVLDLRRKFLKTKNGPFIPYLKNFPLGIMRGGAEESPYRILLGVRQARRKLTKMKKINEANSLVVFQTSNPDMYFFHKSGGLIFLEIPKYNVAFFLFYNKEFEQISDAHEKAMEIIKQVY